MRMWWVLGFAIVVLSSLGATRSCQAGAVDFDEKVYSPLVDEDGDGDAELELRQGADIGKAQDGAAGGVAEFEKALSRKFSLAGLAFWSRDPGKAAKIDELGVESVINLGRLPGTGIDYGTYVELDQGLYGQGATVELKALFEKSSGPWMARLNLIAETPLKQGQAATNLSWAASIDRMAGPRLRLGIEAFADAGPWSRLGGSREAYAGPVAKFDGPTIAHTAVALEAAYLVPIGEARRQTNGQVRLSLELERHF